ncbi:hypothetical protein Aca07nite_39090 [Actinoplanes capillaceus]|uniref:Uncharacterized protein n=1 Tax=Actinoplanes campanulatus TaxID=113559 RepID=A0ABQ3WK80_9ACTN|nr:hypothetical protein [Actinoplanes capillaceus]GID46634.1 hypothetical protein Aca07nite_39090 [Actinoplanes capillaceus]
MSARVLRAIGYWLGPWMHDDLPDVNTFIGGSSAAEERSAVAAYLRSGTTFVATAGFSVCRICGIRNGSTELTDGEHFVWPEGLVHYVEEHDVGLPSEVVAVARRGPARPVDLASFERGLLDTGDLVVDDRWWRSLHQA